MKLWQLSLSLGFNFLLSCLKAITAASCQNRHGTRCAHVLCSSRRPHHSISNGAQPPPSPWASPRPYIQHLALWGRLQALVEVCVAARCYTSLRGPSTGQTQSCVWAARDVRHALTSVYSSAGCRKTSCHFLGETGWCSVLCLCVQGGMGALLPERYDALLHGKSLLLRSHLGTWTVVIHGYFAHVLAGLLQ